MILICLDMTFPRCIRPWHPRCLIWWSLYGRWRVWNSWPKDWWRRCKSPWMKQNGWSPWSTGRGQRVVVLHQLDMLMELLKLSTTYHNIYIYIYSIRIMLYHDMMYCWYTGSHRLCNIMSHAEHYCMQSRWIVHPGPWALAGANIWHTSQAAADHAGRGLEPPRGWHNFGQSYLRGWKRWTACNDFYKPWILPQHAFFCVFVGQRISFPGNPHGLFFCPFP